MPVSHDDLNRFHAFATARLSRGDAATFDELVALWKEQSSAEGDLDSIRRGIADAEAGRLSPVDEAFDRIRQSLAKKP